MVFQPECAAEELLQTQEQMMGESEGKQAGEGSVLSWLQSSGGMALFLWMV